MAAVANPLVVKVHLESESVVRGSKGREWGREWGRDVLVPRPSSSFTF